MKPILLLSLAIMTIFSTTASTVSPDKTDEEGHKLSSLWKDYYKASRADKPQDEVSALEKIKKEAARKDLAWDFYDACEKYVSAKSSINWKLRSELKQQKTSEIEEFGSAVMSFYDMRKGSKSSEELEAFLLNHKEELLSGYNAEFCKHDSGINSFSFGEVLPDIISNDYEYALWSLLARTPRSTALAKEYFADSYPCSALIAYIEISDIDESTSKDKKISALKDYALKYSGKAAGMFARQDLLRLKFRDLTDSKETESKDLVSLKEECHEFISQCKDFQDDKEKALALCCSYPESLLETLNSSEILADYDNGILNIYLRNLTSVKVKISSSSKETISEETLKNPTGSYYLLDTVSFTLPKLDDGEYEIVLQSQDKKTTTELDYSLYRLSLALKQTAEGHSVYVADCVTGEPAKECTLVLLNEADKEVARASVNIKDGFTPLPDELSSKLVKNKWGYSVKAEKALSEGMAPLLSREENIYKKDFTKSSSAKESSQIRANIITDRGAYNIGETAFFKAVLFSGTSEFNTCPSGHPVSAELFDPSGNRLSSLSLSTNDFGSVNGSFTLTKAERGGLYRIKITDGNTNKVIASTSVLADEFVLPTFSLSWNKQTRFYLPGDEVLVSGSVRAYSGHLLGDAALHCEVLMGSDVIIQEEASLGVDGSFSFSFKTLENKTYAHYQIRATVTDKSGETLDFNDYIFVSGRLDTYSDIENVAKGEFSTTDGKGGDIISSDSIRLRLNLNSYNGDTDSTDLYPSLSSGYRLYRGDEKESPILKGTLTLGENDIPVKDLPSGLYSLETFSFATSETGKKYEDKQTSLFLKFSPEDKSVDSKISSFFLQEESGNPSILTGSGRGGIIVAAELYGEQGVLLEQKLVHIGNGDAGEVQKISFLRKDSYPRDLGIQLFYFRDREDYQYSAEFTISEEQMKDADRLILDFGHFVDSATPQAEYSIYIKTEPQAECAASIFDVASEAFRSNTWRETHPYKPTTGISMPDISAVCGVDEISSGYIMAKGASGVRLQSKAVMATAYTADAAIMEDSISEATTEEEAESGNGTSNTTWLRENFEKTIAWEPTLLPDKDGNIELKFKTSDKLSTYRVQLFAHDKSFNNAVAKRDFVVTLPVKVSIVPPNILYSGDTYKAIVTLYNSTDKDIMGEVSLRFLNGTSKDSPVIKECSTNITVPVGGESEFACPVTVPYIPNLGLLASFSTESGKDTFNDALFESVSVLPPYQTILESHSALLSDGADKDSLLTLLRGQFVNMDGNAAEVTEISILDMLKSAFKDGISTNSVNVIDLSSALYSDALLSKIEGGMEGKRLSAEERTSLTSKILSCHNADGGFAWVDGFTSSPIVTAKLLERFYLMEENLPLELKNLIPDAVTFLDNSFFGKSGARSVWFNRIGMENYLYVRSLYPSCKFEVEGIKKTDLKTFRKEAKKYLTPSSSESRKTGGILSKVRRIRTLDNLVGSSAGLDLASSFGIKFLRESKIKSSINKDVSSLVQYAVEHRSGGAYFPNAVTSRGLMDSELSAHAAICEVLDAHNENNLAENIRTWIMIQKETEQWETDPSYIEALSEVLKAKPQTLSLKVLALNIQRTIPFEEIKPASNGISIEKEYRRANGSILNAGDTLHLGERIKGVLKIDNDENRSFVKVTLPFAGALRPTSQTSGVCFSKQDNRFTGYMGYCNVRSDRQEYLFEAYPEFTTEIETEYFVVAEGSFSAPAPTIECLYAPHYRANDRSSQIISMEE